MRTWTKQMTRIAGLITIGALGATFPLTGVAAPGYSEIPTGAQAYFDYVNANGGVNGRKIKYLVRDDGYNPTTTSEVTNELVLKDQVFAMLGALGTPTHSAVVDFLNSEKVPDLFVSSGSIQWGNDPKAKPYTFGWQPDYEIEGKIIGPVSYTHLRAHETRHDLVCRLLLEK